jgi:hypothetical protein
MVLGSFEYKNGDLRFGVSSEGVLVPVVGNRDRSMPDRASRHGSHGRVGNSFFFVCTIQNGQHRIRRI